MTKIIIGILLLLGGFSLAVFLGMILYKDKSKAPAARSKVAKLSEQ
jgi:hypothetical protein